MSTRERLSRTLSGRLVCLRLVSLLCLAVALSVTTSGQQGPPDVSHLRVNGLAASISPRLLRQTGSLEVWVDLVGDPLAVAQGPNAKRRGWRLNAAQQRDYLRMLSQRQDELMSQVRTLGGRELGRVSKAKNAVAVAIDGAQIAALAALPNVRAVRPLVNYERQLAETVPYIGATAVHNAGFDGTSVKIAVLDSGIDYTHHNLGGIGTVEAYTAAFGTTRADAANTTRDGLFPTAKVVEGYDFLGEFWPQQDPACNPSGPPRSCLRPDPDPIDFEGHGTHVADIAAGRSTDGVHKGVAPGATLLAVKVCSSVSTACSGLALLLGMDFALDPNGDGDISDAADVINMSLGIDYGQREDDLAAAGDIAAQLGVTVVAAAGNAGDRPYIVGSPASAPEVIAVAQTQMPSAAFVPLQINSPAAIAGFHNNTATLDWAPIGAGVTGNVAFVGRGCPAEGATPADPYLANPAGKVALIDRGQCNISLKVDRAAKAGAVGALIGLVAPGDAVPFAFGGGDTFVPSLVITQSTSNLIKANIAAPVNVTISLNNSTSLAGSVVGSSSRGPSYSFNSIKPDIAAPGGSVSAQVGTGTGATAFSGTSGATPMIAGSAALLIQAYPARTPAEIKALLMNTAETNIFTNPALQPSVLAPIARVGGGEVRVNRALGIKTSVWDSETLEPSVSFGYVAVDQPQTFKRSVEVHNYGASARTYSISPAFRYDSDEERGALTFQAPASISAPPNGSATFDFKVKIDASKLPTWNINGGSQGGNGPLLQTLEFDGYVTLSDGTDTVTLPWHVLPHKAAAVTPSLTAVTLIEGAGSVVLSNTTGARTGRVDVFGLTGTSPKIQTAFLADPGDAYAVIDLKSVGTRLVGIGGGQFGVQFAITTFGERSHPNYPAEFDVYIDSNRDGVPDFVVFNLENGGFGVSGQNVVGVYSFATNQAQVFFFTDADLDSSNVILTAPLSALGLTPSTTFDFSVYAGDNYFTGALTDGIENMTVTLGTPKYVGSGVPAAGVPVGGTSTLLIQALPGGDAASPSQTGLLLMYRDGKIKKEADAIRIVP